LPRLNIHKKTNRRWAPAQILVAGAGEIVRLVSEFLRTDMSTPRAQ
jgi:hypothetical protein